MTRSLLGILCIILISCGEKVIEPPEDLLSKEKMEDILYDLAVINAAKGTNPKILEEQGIEPTEFLFKKHNIDSIQFVKSDLYYASVPSDYKAIYERVTSRLEQDKKQIEDQQKKKNDSSRGQSGKRNQKIKKPTTRTAQDTLP